MTDGRLSLDQLLEKVDIYALGNVFFRIIFKHDPWKEFRENGRIAGDASVRIAELKRLEGGLPKFDEPVMTSVDSSIVAIRTIMMKCFERLPEDRPTASFVADYLSEEYENLKNAHYSPPTHITRNGGGVVRTA